MHDLMVALQEVEQEDLIKSRSGGTTVLASPIAPSPAVAEPAEESADMSDVAAPDEETFAAMRWASQLHE